MKCVQDVNKSALDTKYKRLQSPIRVEACKTGIISVLEQFSGLLKGTVSVFSYVET